MSLKRNILANYASQFYVTAVGIIIVPFYIRYMGPEAYGLVGFFTVLQAFFNLLDLGLSQTVARESARYSGGDSNAVDFRRLVRALEGVFASIAIAGAILLLALAEFISGYWLNASILPRTEIKISLQLMAIVVALRWMSGLYRGVISGAEQFVWLSSFNSLVATGRFILVLPILMFYSASPSIFFSFQLGVSVLELAGIAFMAYRIMPSIPAGQTIRWQWAPLKPILRFSLSIAFTSCVWALVTQTDKLVLSKLLPLAEYGYFTVAVLVAGGLMVVSGPISTAILPRMARLHAENRYDQLTEVYRHATQLVTVVVVPVTLILVFFAPQVLWAWTGDANLVDKAAPALALYALGYGILAISAFQYYLQYAVGDLKLHLIGSAIFVMVLVPSLIWAASKHGMVGAGWAWLVCNGLYFIFWTPLVHRRFAPGLHASWMFSDVLKPALLPIFAVILFEPYMLWSTSRAVLTGQLLCIAATLLTFAYLMASRVSKFNQK